MLLPELASFTNLGLPATKLWQSEHNLFQLQILKPLVVDVTDRLVPEIMFDLIFCPLGNKAVPMSLA